MVQGGPFAAAMTPTAPPRRKIATMTVDVQVETTIGRPVADVATFAGDPTNAPL